VREGSWKAEIGVVRKLEGGDRSCKGGGSAGQSGNAQRGTLGSSPAAGAHPRYYSAWRPGAVGMGVGGEIGGAPGAASSYPAERYPTTPRAAWRPVEMRMGLEAREGGRSAKSSEMARSYTPPARTAKAAQDPLSSKRRMGGRVVWLTRSIILSCSLICPSIGSSDGYTGSSSLHERGRSGRRPRARMRS
jgi:hypothetical protein